MSEYDKDLIAKTFAILGDQNLECVVLITINVSGISINNLDIKLAI